MDNSERAGNMVCRAYQMYLSSGNQEDSFPMYSYDRPAPMFWMAFCETLFDRGLNEAQVEDILRSKEVRWMLDSIHDELKEFVEKIVEKRPHFTTTDGYRGLI